MLRYYQIFVPVWYRQKVIMMHTKCIDKDKLYQSHQSHYLYKADLMELDKKKSQPYLVISSFGSKRMNHESFVSNKVEKNPV